MACKGGCCGSNKATVDTREQNDPKDEIAQKANLPVPSTASSGLEQAQATETNDCCDLPSADPIKYSQPPPYTEDESKECIEDCCGTIGAIQKSPASSNTECQKACCTTNPVVTATTGALSQCTSLSRDCCSSDPSAATSEPITIQSGCGTDLRSACCTGRTQSVSSSSCTDDCCAQEDSDSNVIAAGTESPCCTTERTKCGTVTKDTGCCAGVASTEKCCGDATKNITVDEVEFVSSGSDLVDLEKGNTGREHIILSISGMTCTGCETKLKRTLGTLHYVSNLKTSLVLARAEFDIVQGAASAEDVIKHLQRTTEFKCEHISNQGSSLDCIFSGDQTSYIKGEWPDGVLDVRRMDKETIRIDFDAKVVGARDLLEQPWSRPLRLAPPRPDPGLDAGSRHVRHMGWLTLLSAALTIPVLVLAWAPLPEREIAYGSASLALATIVQVVIAGPFYPKAIKALVFSRVIEMDLLIVLSTSAAYIFSVVSFGYLVAGHPLSTGEFFETSTLLVTLIMVGRWVASLARQKAAESISIRSLQTPTAILVEDAQVEKEIDARLLQYGDVFKVAPDSRIPTDGTVISGASEIDESMLTGESKPLEKQVFA